MYLHFNEYLEAEKGLNNLLKATLLVSIGAEI